jgi:hypothetical protein
VHASGDLDASTTRQVHVEQHHVGQLRRIVATAVSHVTGLTDHLDPLSRARSGRR